MNKPLKISRSGLKLFLECPRCFWLDLHHKIKRPPGYPFTLAIAVDHLVKKEFDAYRAKGELHPVFAKLGLDPAQSDSLPAGRQALNRQVKGRTLGGAGVKLYAGEDIGTWRNNFKGISYFDEDLQAMLYGAVDDVLEFADGSMAVVDYKSTGAKVATVYDDYQKQMDTYAYILERMGNKVYPTAYFVFYVVDKSGDAFNNVLPFNDEVKTVSVDASWVGGAFERAVKTARQDKAPAPGADCKHCKYVGLASQHGGFDLPDTQADRSYIVVEE